MQFTRVFQLTSKVGVPFMTLLISLLATGAALGVSGLTFPLFSGIALHLVVSAVVSTAFIVAAPIAFALVRTIVRMDEQSRDLNAHQQLLVATQRFARLGTWEYDARNRVLTISDYLHELLGDRDRTQVITIPKLLRMVHPADRKMLEAAFERILHAGSREHVEFRLTGLDGSERTLWITGVRSLDENGSEVKAFGACQDISDRKAMQAALKESEDHFRHAVKLSPLITFTTDPDGSNERIAKRWSDVTGLTLDGSDPYAWARALHPDDVEKATAEWSEALATGGNYNSEYRLQCANGKHRWFHARAAARRDAAGRIMRWYGTVEDIHSRKKAELELRTSETFAHSILNSSADCVQVLGLDGRIQFMNNPGLRLMEVTDFELFRDKHWATCWPEQAQPEVTLALRMASAGTAVRYSGFCPTAKGNPRWWDACISPIPGADGATVQLLCTSRDITEQHRSAEKIRHMALHDGLTGLSNRVKFCDKLHDALRTCSDEAQTAVLFLDLDEFKSINDAYGHPVGDALLCEAGKRLRSCVRDGETIARFGGDEFAVLQSGVTALSQVQALAERIIDCLSAPYRTEDRLVFVGVSIGIATANSPDVSSDNLLRDADIALYRAKADGGRTWQFYEQGMAIAVQDSQSLKDDLRRALSASELNIEFQPLVNLETDCVTGFEALLRWNHPQRGLISPADFIPLAEQTGLIVGIGEWVLLEACRSAEDWPSDILVSVNLSPVQFRNKGLVEAVSRALRISGLSPHRLQLEITENVLLQNSRSTHEALAALRNLGIRIAMDDFGLGYSSLSYLKSFPFDTIKVDRSFIADLPENPNTMSIVRAVLAMGQALGISTTAEGVESEQQASVLRGMGCREGQGYLFSKAVSANQIPEVLAQLSKRKKNAEPCALPGRALEAQ